MSALRFQLKKVLVVIGILLEMLLDGLLTLKGSLVRRMFWGRGSLYKNSFHIAVGLVSIGLLLTGLMNKISAVDTDASLPVAYGAYGNLDSLWQGSSLTAVVPVDTDAPNYRVFKHLVQEGETATMIADKYDVSVATLLWANDRILNPFDPQVRVGMELRVPEINGVLYAVKPGETLDSIVSKSKGADRFSVIELNDLVPPNYKLTVGQRLFLPEAELPPAPLPGLVPGLFDDPLSHPKCRNYKYIRGFSPWHGGVDLAKGGGCPIRAVAAGTVVRAGLLDGVTGWGVLIDHGSGIHSLYAHGNGEMWVKTGDFVSKGQDIMHMGNSGNSRGTHLHLSMIKNGIGIDPASYIPYRRR